MKLYIDTSDNRKTIVALGDFRVEKPTGVDKSQQVLALIEKALGEKDISIDKIKAIEVNLGPGSFVGLRVGIAVANALSYFLGIPINEEKCLVEPKYDG